MGGVIAGKEELIMIFSKHLSFCLIRFKLSARSYVAGVVGLARAERGLQCVQGDFRCFVEQILVRGVMGGGGALLVAASGGGRGGGREQGGAGGKRKRLEPASEARARALLAGQ